MDRVRRGLELIICDDGLLVRLGINVTLPPKMPSISSRVRSMEETDMRRSRYREEQIMGILTEHQAGLPVLSSAASTGSAALMFYKRRSKYGGMEVSAPRS